MLKDFLYSTGERASRVFKKTKPEPSQAPSLMSQTGGKTKWT